MSNLNPAAIGKGAAVAAAIGLVFGLVGRAAGADSSLMYVLVIVIFAGMALGGYVAGRDEPDYGLTNGGVAALAAAAALQLVNVVLAAAKGTLSSSALVTVVFILLLSTSMGVIGGYVAFRRAGTNANTADAKGAL